MRHLIEAIIVAGTIFLIFHFSIVSTDAIESFFRNIGVLDLFILIMLSLVIVNLTYLRFSFCLGALSLSCPPKEFMRINTGAYTLGQILPGQLGIDGLRIYQLKHIDSSAYKSKLLAATILEKVASLVAQISILALLAAPFLYPYVKDYWYVALALFLAMAVLVPASVIVLYCGSTLRDAYRKKGFTNISPGRIVRLLGFSMLLSGLACLLITQIAWVMNGERSLPSLASPSMAMLVSNLSAVLPITPNGIGVSEFVYSRVMMMSHGGESSAIFGSSYLIFRFCNLSMHLLMFCSIRLRGVIESES